MGKINVKDRDGTTRILYQKSNHTIFTQSRTCSGVSQIYTKSGMVNIKRNLSETKQYYLDGDKIKRDLSIETDICIIRRYCKKIKNKLSVQEGSRSKYSTVVDTEIGTIDEFEADTSACGDSEQQDQIKIENVNLDIAKLVMDNFRDLLNNWIKQYLLENKETKEKLETVLYSIIHKREAEKAPSKSSSRSTYLLNSECLSSVKNKKVKTVSICDVCKNKYANENHIDYENPSHSSPTSLKKIKVVSTLSIPRNLHKKGKETKCKSNQKIKKTKHKNLVLSIKKSSVMGFSSYDFLSVSAEAFTKRCTNFNAKKEKNSKKKRHIVFFPKPFYKSATDTSAEENYLDEVNTKNNLADMPSLVQSIYADDPANVDSSDSASIPKNDNFTMTDNHFIDKEIKYRNTNTNKEKSISGTMFLRDRPTFDKPNLNELDQSQPLITIDFINETSNSSTNKTRSIRSTSLNTIENKIENNVRKGAISARNSKLKCFKNRSKKTRYRPYNKYMKFQNIQSKQFTFLYKKSNSQYMRGKRFLEHCQEIMKYFTECNMNNDLKLNIHINVIPVKDVTNKDDFTEMSQEDVSVITSDTIIYNIEPKIVLTNENNDRKYENGPSIPENIRLNVTEDIIPLLDGTLSHSKYLLKTESSITNTETIGLSNDTATIKDKMTKDHSTHTQTEIAEDIRELKAVIKDLTRAAEAFLKEHLNKEPKIFHFNDDTTCTEDTNISKGIQISNEAGKPPLVSGIKLSKSPKKNDANDFIKRIMQKSASYNVIDSEMILRVTDMTSAANTKKSSINLKFKPKSKSLIEINEKLKKKLITYYCGQKPQRPCRPPPCKKKKVKKPPCQVDSDAISIRTDFSDCPGCVPKESSKCCIFDDDDDDDDDDDCCEEDEEKGLCPVKNCRRKGMAFGEGFVYCLLLWIPVVIIISLFYNYVVKEVVGPEKSGRPAAIGLENQPKNSRNNFVTKGLNGSVFYVQLSDLGF